MQNSTDYYNFDLPMDLKMEPKTGVDLVNNTAGQKLDNNCNETRPVTTNTNSLQNSPSAQSPDSADQRQGFLSPDTTSVNQRMDSPSLNLNSTGLPTMVPMNLVKRSSSPQSLENAETNSQGLISPESTPFNQRTDSPISNMKPSIPSTGLPTMIPMNLVKRSTSPQSHESADVTGSNSFNLTNASPTQSASRTKSSKSGSKKSFVWRYFHHPKTGEDGIPDKTRTQCLLCKSQLAFNASGTTTTMLNHLKSRHSNVAESEEMNRRHNKMISSISTTKSSNNGKTSTTAHSKKMAASAGIPANSLKHNQQNPDANGISTSSSSGPSPVGQSLSSRNKQSGEVMRDILYGDLKQDSSPVPKHQQSTPLGLDMAFSTSAASLLPNMTQNFFSSANTSGVFDQSVLSKYLSGLNSLSLSNFLPPNQFSQLQMPPTSLHGVTSPAFNHGQILPLHSTPIDTMTGLGEKKLTPRSTPGKRKRMKPIQIKQDNNAKKSCLDVTNSSSLQFDEWNSAFPRKLNKSSSGSADVKVRQSHLHNSGNFSCHSLNINRVSEALAFFLVKDLLPVNILNGSGFQTLMKELAPSLPSPSAELLRKETLPFLYKRTRAQIMEEFQESEVNGAALSLEIWSRENKSYASTKVHYLDSEMKMLKCKLLKTQEINAQVLCSQLLLDCHSSLNLSESNRFCPVVVNHPDLLLDELTNAELTHTKPNQFMVIPCLVSCLSEALKAGFSVPSVAALVSRCKSLIDDIESSPSIVELNQEYGQPQGDRNTESPFNQVPNNEPGSSDNEDLSVGENDSWCRLYATLKRVGDHYKQLKSQYRDSVSYQDMLLTKEEEALLYKLIPSIESINQTLETLNNRSLFLTASMIKPILCNLRKKQLSTSQPSLLPQDVNDVITEVPLSPQSPTGSSSSRGSNYLPPLSIGTNGKHGDTSSKTSPEDRAVADFKTAVWNHLSSSFVESGEIHDALWIATLLDPRFKRSLESHSTSLEEKTRLIRKLKEEVGESLEMDIIENEKVAENADDSDLDQVFGQDLVMGHSSTSAVDRYLVEPPVTLKENPFRWWAAKSHHFPQVAAVARRYLCIPVTCMATGNATTLESQTTVRQQTPYARATGIAGDQNCSAVSLMANRRAGIDPEDLDIYLFLSHNWQFDHLSNGQ